MDREQIHAREIYSDGREERYVHRVSPSRLGRVVWQGMAKGLLTGPVRNWRLDVFAGWAHGRYVRVKERREHRTHQL